MSATSYLRSLLGDPVGDCILWPFSLSSNGYPQMSHMGRQRRAHQVVLELSGRERPPGYVARHLCGVRQCINPDHLEWATQSENMLDRRLHGTDPNAGKTHCKSGHEFDESNTKIRPNGNRDCRACNTEASRKYRASLR